MKLIQNFLEKKGIEDIVVTYDKYNEPVTPSYILQEFMKELCPLHDVVVNEADIPADETMLDEPVKYWKEKDIELPNSEVELCKCKAPTFKETLFRREWITCSKCGISQLT